MWRGATAAYAGSDQPFYLAMGFEPYRRHPLWRRVLDLPQVEAKEQQHQTLAAVDAWLGLANAGNG